MSLSPQEYYFEFSYYYCDTIYSWGVRNLRWGIGAAYDMEGFAHLGKMLPFPCYNTYKSMIDKISLSNDDATDMGSLPIQQQWKIKFDDFDTNGSGKLSLPYKFLQLLDPDAFQEIQETTYHSIAKAKIGSVAPLASHSYNGSLD